MSQPASISDDNSKLIFGTVFSLRNMVRKLGGDDDAFMSYRTADYKLHFYETPANLRFVIMTDTATMSMRNVLHQIYINLWVEYGTSFLPIPLPPLPPRHLPSPVWQCGLGQEEEGAKEPLFLLWRKTLLKHIGWAARC